ncbi:MAG: methyl-accepting chemotaxis protein [Lachnospiraceae bacterium]|nr:methyl-accepting chemotaxis protein [Lachnospiraceae bacterium]
MAKKEKLKAKTKINSNGKKKRTGKLAVKILVPVFLILLVVVVVNNYMALSSLKESLLSEKVTSIEDCATEKANALEQYIGDQKVLAQMYRSDVTVLGAAVKYLKEGTEFDEDTRTHVAESLAALYNNTGNVYENLFITVGSMGYADCLGNTTLHDCSEETFYTECMEKGYYFGNNISPVTGRPVYVIAYSIPDPTDETAEPLGTVNMSIDMEAMGKDIIASDKYEVTVVDHTGIIVATNRSADSILTSIGDDATVQGLLSSVQGYNLVDLSAYGMGKNYIAFQTTDNFITEVMVNVSTLESSVNQLTTKLILVAAIIGILGLIIIALIIMSIVKPLKTATKDITQTISDIKAGHGDLTKKIAVKSNDEIGITVDCVNELTETLGGIIAQVQDTTDTVTTSSSDVSAKIEKAEFEITNVSATMEEMSASSQQTSASMTQVMNQVDNVAELVQDMNASSIEQAQYAEEVAEKVKKIQETSASKREAANQQLHDVAENLRTKINNAKQVSEIANLTDEILNITSQTNLLSLNASIEAARAGEAGKGFAVVADEIRQLADSSKEAANRIQEVTASVIVAVEDLATEAENVTDFMLENNESTHKETDELTDNYSSDIKQLAESMTGFRQSSDVIQNSMDVIKEAIDAVTRAAEETAQGIVSVAESTADLNAQLTDVGEMTSDNVAKTNSLSAEINKFKIS